MTFITNCGTISNHWSKKHDKCVNCGKTESPHKGNGMCRKCWANKRYRENPEPAKLNASNYQRRVGKAWLDERYSRYKFGGNRTKALIRDGYKCTRCGGINQLQVHHIDEKGVNVPREMRNNSLDNLITLCVTCHGIVHGANGRWSKKYDCCVVCGETSSSHSGKGVCTACNKKRYIERTILRLMITILINRKRLEAYHN